MFRSRWCSICSDAFIELSVFLMPSESAESIFTGHSPTISQQIWRHLPSNPFRGTGQHENADTFASREPESPVVSPDILSWQMHVWLLDILETWRSQKATAVGVCCLTWDQVDVLQWSSAPACTLTCTLITTKNLFFEIPLNKKMKN